MDVEITRLDGNSFRLSEYNVSVRDFIVGSIPVLSSYGSVEGRSGVIDYGAEYGQRTITVPFYMKAHDFADFPLLRDELFSLVVSREPFYIRELRKIDYGFGENQYVGGKRYEVRISGAFDIEQQLRYGFGELAFETSSLPFAESIGTTQDIERDGVGADSEIWGFGMGIIADDESLVYTYTGTSFRIYNAGDVPIHPFEQQFKITIDNITGSSSYFELRNTTTGNIFRVNELANGTIILDGPNITKNSLNYLRQTNKKFIELALGWNDFSVHGASSARVSFDFPFYYK